MLELARESDFEAVNHIARQVVAHHAQWNPNEHLVDYPYPMDFFLTCIHPESIHENAIYVMRRDNAVVGYMRIYLWQTNSTTSEKRTILSIDDIGVEAALRNRGIGTKMMDGLRELSANWSVSSICLYVDAPNKSAQAYYRKCGFQIKNLGMTLNL